MKLLLFDVDATLILTGGAGLRALDRTFQDLFKVGSAMDGVAPHGKTDPAIVREIFNKRLDFGTTLPDAEMSRILETYAGYLHEEVESTEKYEVLPGILDLLEKMVNRDDVLLGLATGNIENGARIKLRRGDLNRFFAFGGFGSDSESRVDLVRRAAERASVRSGQISPDDTWVIGDTPRDIDAGRAAGFRTVGVATGQYTVEQLRECGADLAISNFREDRDYFLRSTFIE